MNLSSFIRKDLSKSIIDKYKSEYKQLSHIRINKNTNNAVYIFTTQLRAGLFSAPNKKKCNEAVEAVLNTASYLYPDISIGYKPVNTKRIYL